MATLPRRIFVWPPNVWHAAQDSLPGHPPGAAYVDAELADRHRAQRDRLLQALEGVRAWYDQYRDDGGDAFAYFGIAGIDAAIAECRADRLPANDPP